MKRILFSLAAVALLAFSASPAHAAQAQVYTNLNQMLTNYSPLNATKVVFVGGTSTNGDGGAGWWTVVTNTLATNNIRIASPLNSAYALARIPLKEDTSTNTYASTSNIDFLGPKFQLLTVTGAATTFTASNVAAGREVILRLEISDGALGSAFTFPAWKFIGAAAVTGMPPAKVATLRLTAFGTAATNVHASLTQEP